MTAKYVQGIKCSKTNLDIKYEVREIGNKVIKIYPPVLVGFARNVLYHLYKNRLSLTLGPDAPLICCPMLLGYADPYNNLDWNDDIKDGDENHNGDENDDDEVDGDEVDGD